jgi:hypothetical protein
LCGIDQVPGLIQGPVNKADSRGFLHEKTPRTRSHIVGGFQMSADLSHLQEQLAKTELQLREFYNATAKAAYELAALYNHFNVSDRTHDDEYVARVRARHIRTIQRIARELSAAIRTSC